MKRARDETGADASHRKDAVRTDFEPEDLPLVRALLPDLDAGRLRTLGCLAALTRAWNDRVNLISRKDAEHIEATKTAQSPRLD